MPQPHITADDVQALQAFIEDRVNEEWEAINTDEDLDPDAAARFYRVSNSNKYGLAGMAESVVHLLAQGNAEAVERAWHLLTGAGEQWREHPDYLSAWENPQMARVRLALGG
ncbi:hypothetical protein [Streptomyces sp. sk2.1]|uniref:hypothetical protein n=1 Tax=Streptomyces sp. sk2.1 TaxID=2478959 RepID=UPI0011E66AF5|nr:hypothetical protein [Streptomyces sp. sk2.1]TXS68918.1 hypothetical protein EAO76_26495 [Streptomyces sp. sk2.1]